MNITRNNHYVPRWYQEGFLSPGKTEFFYLDLHPPTRTLADGRTITETARFKSPVSRCFRAHDLYSTFFGASVNDEVERRLFGDIDVRGSRAIRAFIQTDVEEWHRHFGTFFEYIDVQKLRTPKGLGWLRLHYPSLSQNELMAEMQALRFIHCSIWTSGVREIVSAKDSSVKFIISDHPVTVFNYALDPTSDECQFPNDPSIAQRGTQTIFPLDSNNCLILTNLEYAQDIATPPKDKRTFPRNYSNALVNTTKLIRTRSLSEQQVLEINYIIKARAGRFLAAGREEWLHPERLVHADWKALRQTLRPPEDEIWHFGGEIFAKYDDGRVHYQDEFGRTEEKRDFLAKAPIAGELRGSNQCGCGSGRQFKACCQPKRKELRPTWDELSIRERNIRLANGIANVLELHEDNNWVAVRRKITDEKIATVYRIFEALWPLETDLLQLLPKPDGTGRAVYTGSIHPTTISKFALGASIYFGELLIEHPFAHAGILNDRFKPTKAPQSYRQEFLKSVKMFLDVMPLVYCGLVNLFPDPGIFDAHLREQVLRLATERASGTRIDTAQDHDIHQIMRDDYRRSLAMLSDPSLRSQIRRAMPELRDSQVEIAVQEFRRLHEQDPLGVLQPDSPDQEKGGQLSLMKLAPNFEMTMYLAQATGASIVTDSSFRWSEIQRAAVSRASTSSTSLPRGLESFLASTNFEFVPDALELCRLANDPALSGYQPSLAAISKYLSRLTKSTSRKINFEDHLVARLKRVHEAARLSLARHKSIVRRGRISVTSPLGGIRDNSINRLLLMSSSEHHLPSVPMAFYIQPD